MNLSAEDVIKDGEISIGESQWKALTSAFDKDEVKQLISDAMGMTPLPYRKIIKEDAEKDFRKLCDVELSNLEKHERWFTRYDYEAIQYADDYILGCNNTGNKSSDYFQQHNRWLCDSINAPSPYRTWTTEKFRLTLLNALWSLKVDEVNPKVLRSCIGLRKYIAAQFRASTAKVIYDQFSGSRVLDLSAGWGDRLAGFAASNASEYVGIDPNNRVHRGYSDQIRFYSGILNSPVNATMIEACAEDVDPRVYGTFDLVFTSPPYFNIERYTHEDNQSFKRYKKLDQWLHEFLFKALDNGWKALNSGGTMIINISDVYSGHKINKICDPMVDYMKTKGDLADLSVIGYEMRKRPNSKALKGKEGLFCEPMWIFNKR